MTTIVPQVACSSCGAIMSKFRVRSHPRSAVSGREVRYARSRAAADARATTAGL